MPLNLSIKTVLVIGAGPIIIGQACEFDYSGTQACKALKEEGCKVILLNSNPATIMTDTDIADAVYIEPITSEIVEKIIQKEKPDSLLPIVGGQTALNCARELAEKGLLQKYNVNLIGLHLSAIEKAENRETFKKEIKKIGLETPESFYATKWNDAELAQKKLGYPLIIRSFFTLGGKFGGIAHNKKELKQICERAFSHSAEILIEQSLIGWKEYELEVMRDNSGNCIVVCGIENIDPMGVHTGDSITVSPIQTLTDKEYQYMRKKAFRVMETIGMTSGGCNVQFAIHPKTGKMFCIEINPRVSRSSALASKATGYPIAKIATKLALGYTLNELKNTLTSHLLPSSFEPALDYVVTKIPRFDFDKFPNANQNLSTHMKSIGEVIGIGRTVKESLNKALSSLDISSKTIPTPRKEIREKLKIPHPNRLWFIFEAFKNGFSIEEIQNLTHFDPWFLDQFLDLVKEEDKISKNCLSNLEFNQLYRWKQMGFSDQRLAFLLQCQEKNIAQKRRELNIYPVYKRIDSCSAEFPNETPYMYSTYEEECESEPTKNKKVLVIGSGPNRIGQGIEFDYCTAHAVNSLRKLGYESIIINCNPETVSTDYDTSDRLYIEPLTDEYVLEVLRIEKPIGTVIQFGGQTPINIGKSLHKNKIAILGTPFESIDLAENREKFRIFAEKIGLKQPKNASFFNKQEALKLANEIGFPMILRPSYIIGGNSIQMIQNENELKQYVNKLPLNLETPILMEQFLEDALEVEVDAICDGEDVFICGICEQIEPSGVHSGDSMTFLFPYQLSAVFQKALIEQAKKVGLSLNIVGLFNIQFAIHKKEIFILEVNPRASRTIPLLSKTTGLPFVQIAMKCMLGQSLKKQNLPSMAQPRLLGLKLPVFPFSSLHLKNEKLEPKMKSTGEVLCLGKNLNQLLMKARIYALQNKELFTRDLEHKLPKPDTSVPLEINAIKDTFTVLPFANFKRIVKN